MKAKGRSELYREICTQATREEKALAEKRVGYRMPTGYISRKSLTELGLASLVMSNRVSCPIKTLPEDIRSHLMLCRALNGWAESSSPLYCVAPEIMEALSFTNSLDKQDILRDFKPPFQCLLIAVPEDSIYCPGGREPNIYIDFLLVVCLDANEIRDTLIIGIMAADSDGDTWTLKVEIDKFGKVANDDDGETEEDNILLKKIRNLVVSVLLLLNTSENSIVSEVLPSQTVDDSNKSRGFGKKAEMLPPKYPRWIGKNYQIKSQRKQVLGTTTGTHTSPRTHWRCGHFRRLEPGEGKKWIEPRTLWIEPILVKAGVD